MGAPLTPAPHFLSEYSLFEYSLYLNIDRPTRGGRARLTELYVVGRTIGNYRVVALLGQGGMGRVYLAHHPGIERRSAIKVLHSDLADDPATVSRFFAEARAANAIRHPNIVEIFDSGTLEDGAPYIIMEYLEGETLAARVTRGLLLGEALDFAGQAASALHAAHQKGIIHRDIKPENLFIVRDPAVGKGERLKVLDFGVAKLQQHREEPAHRTRSGALVGTPRYMSPEQCLGDREVDLRSDVYSLGVIIYEMLCGRPPFLSEGVGSMINMHINRPPDPPRQLNPSLTASLEATILKALAKNPADRFTDMFELLEALRVAQISLGSARHTLPPRESGMVTVAPTPTPLSAMATLVEDLPAVLRSTLPPAQATTPATPSEPPQRRFGRWGFAAVAVAEVAVAVAIFFLALKGDDEALTPVRLPRPAQMASSPADRLPPVVLPPTVLPPAPPPPAAAETAPEIVVRFESEPPGALVRTNDSTLGKTPFDWSASPDRGTTAFVFDKPGYRAETVLAVPARGLRLRPLLRKLRQPRPPAEKPPEAEPPPDDIKSER